MSEDAVDHANAEGSGAQGAQGAASSHLLTRSDSSALTSTEPASGEGEAKTEAGEQESREKQHRAPGQQEASQQGGGADGASRGPDFNPHFPKSFPTNSHLLPLLAVLSDLIDANASRQRMLIEERRLKAAGERISQPGTAADRAAEEAEQTEGRPSERTSQDRERRESQSRSETAESALLVEAAANASQEKEMMEREREVLVQRRLKAERESRIKAVGDNMASKTQEELHHALGRAEQKVRSRRWLGDDGVSVESL